MPFAPVDPNATLAARQLLHGLYAISGRRTMSGQHNFPGKISDYSDEASQIGGQYPALWGQDFGFSADDQDGVQFRDRVVQEAIRQHEAGSVVTLMWHAVRPTHDEPVTFKDNILGSLTDAEWAELTTPGTRLHTRWIEQSDRIADGLKVLKDADVPVLWRPYHEMNGDWFWWCNRPGPLGYEALYRQLYKRFVEVHGLHNLIWVWNANAPRANAAPYAAFFPGYDVVDVLATDVYSNDYRDSHYQELAQLAAGRPIALGEVGQMPTPEILEAQPLWTWFMTWSGMVSTHNEASAVRALYDASRVLHREERCRICGQFASSGN